jgi:peptidoglycan/xylan/chitin deacetylase (PgdA/CDA1 family)
VSPRGALAVVWDFDTAVGQVNATYPYHFRRAPLEEELAAVAELRGMASRLGTPMTFATVGLAAEDLSGPFGAGDQLRALHEEGHEVASHSWRHEWLPHLTTQQLRRSLVRSKLALESAIGAPGAVEGFVPPFNRPMTWLARGEVRPGDRWAVPPAAGATLDRLIPTVAGAGYRWIRAGYGRRWGRRVGDRLWAPEQVGGCTNLPQHHNGFDGAAHDLLDEAVARRRLVVVAGHPAGLARPAEENRDLVVALLEAAARRRDAGELDVVTMGRAAARSRGEEAA